MARLPNTEFQQLVPLLRDKEFYDAEPQRLIDWPTYTRIQIEDVKQALQFIKKTVDDSTYLLVPGKTGRPLTDPKILAKAILLAELLGAPERPSQGWSSILGPAVGIINEIDDRVIGEAYDNLEVLYILKQVFENNTNSDGRLSGDGTYWEMSRKHNYESTKKQHGVSLTSIVDSREIVQAFTTHQNEVNAMHELIKKSKATAFDSTQDSTLVISSMKSTNSASNHSYSQKEQHTQRPPSMENHVHGTLP